MDSRALLELLCLWIAVYLLIFVRGQRGQGLLFLYFSVSFIKVPSRSLEFSPLETIVILLHLPCHPPPVPL